MKKRLLLSFFMLLIAIQGVYAQCTTPPVPSITSSGSTSICTGGSVTLSVNVPTYGVVSTLAGSGSASYADGTGTGASFALPTSVACDVFGNVYVADQYAHRIRKISSQGVVSTFAGSGSAGFANGQGTSASFYEPISVACDPSGNVYVADSRNNSIRKITSSGLVSTLAGSGIRGNADGTGTNAGFAYPISVSCDAFANVYVADLSNHCIRKITSAGITTTFAGSGVPDYLDGTGLGARFHGPYGVACDGQNNVYVADLNNNRVRKITPAGVVTTLAGSNTRGYLDGNGANANLSYPSSLACDPAGNVFITEMFVNRIRKISSTGDVTTFVGSGVAGYADGTGTASLINNPTGIACDATGTIFLADQGNYRIRKIVQNLSGIIWSTNETTASIVASTAGSYSIRTINGACTSAAGIPTIVSVLSPVAVPSITAGSSTSLCTGGSVTLYAPTGTSPLWSTGATTASITVNAAGAYTLRSIIGACTSASSSPVTVVVNSIPSAPTITASGATSICNGTSVTLSAPAGTTPLWSTGATTSSINVSNAGSYTLRIINGTCTSVASTAVAVTVITLPATPSITASGSSAICAGSSISLSAPNGTSALWSTGESTASIVVSTAGTYTLRSISGNCTSAASVPVVVTVNDIPATPTISVYAFTTFCGNEGPTLIAPSGITPIWYSGSTQISYSGSQLLLSSSGTYTLRALVGNCTSAASAPVVLNSIVVPTPTITASGSTVLCTGNSVTLNAPAGTTPLWSNGATTASIVVNSAGSYTLRSIIGSCTSAASAATVVTAFSGAAPTITTSGSTTFCTGSVTLSAPIGTTALWSNGATTPSITVSDYGVISLRIVNGACTSAASPYILIDQGTNATPRITASGPTTFCTGSVTLSAPAGVIAPFWSTGATTTSITVSTSGSYSLSDMSNGCQSPFSTPVVVTTNTNPTPTIIKSGSSSICNGNILTLTAPAGVSSPLWSTGATTPSIQVSTVGTFTLRDITNGCTSAVSTPVVSTIVNTPMPAAPVINAIDITNFCAGGSVMLVSDVASPDRFVWSNGSTLLNRIVVTTSGTYRLYRLTNNGACTSAASNAIVVTVTDRPARPNITPLGSTTICAGGSVTLSAPAGFSYLWIAPDGRTSTTPTVEASKAGEYYLYTINGTCTSQLSYPATVTIATPAVPVITANGPTNFCERGSVTSVLLSVPAGFNYLWSNGSFGTSIYASTSGAYTVRAISSNGACTSAASAPIQVVVNTMPQTGFIISGSRSLCNGETVTLTATADAPDIRWNTGQNGRSITVRAEGRYAYTAINGACWTESIGFNITNGGNCTSWNGTSWSNGLPDATKEVYINGNLTVSSPLTASTIVFKTGIVTLNANFSAVAAISNRGCTFNGTGAVVLAGTFGYQSLSGTFSNVIVNNNTSIGAAASDSVRITSCLTLRSGIFDSRGMLILTPGAYIDNYSSGNSGTITGQMIVQVRRSTTSRNLFDFSFPLRISNVSTFSNLFFVVSLWDEARNGYFPGTITSTTIDNNGPAGYRANSTIPLQVYQGTLKTGAFSTRIYRSAFVAGVDKGYNALGNPYCSPISWTLLNTLNSGVTNGFAQVFNSSTGQYGTISSNGAVTNGVSNNIAIGQGFLIRNMSASNTVFNFNNSVRVAGSASFVRASAETNNIRLQLSSLDNASLPSDETIIQDAEGATADFDDNDLAKLHSPLLENISLYTIAGTTELAVNAQSTDKEGFSTIPVGIRIASAGKYAIAATELANFNLSHSIVLQDVLLGTKVVLHAGDSYSFNSEEYKGHRFNIMLHDYANGSAKIATVSSIGNYQARVTFINEDVMKEASVRVLNTLGQLVLEIPTGTLSQQTDINLPLAGMYVIQILSPSGKTSTKIISR